MAASEHVNRKNWSASPWSHAPDLVIAIAVRAPDRAVRVAILADRIGAVGGKRLDQDARRRRSAGVIEQAAPDATVPGQDEADLHQGAGRGEHDGIGRDLRCVRDARIGSSASIVYVPGGSSRRYEPPAFVRVVYCVPRARTSTLTRGVPLPHPYGSSLNQAMPSTTASPDALNLRMDASSAVATARGLVPEQAGIHSFASAWA
jgi:hypothetical protein